MTQEHRHVPGDTSADEAAIELELIVRGHAHAEHRGLAVDRHTAGTDPGFGLATRGRGQAATAPFAAARRGSRPASAGSQRESSGAEATRPELACTAALELVRFDGVGVAGFIVDRLARRRGRRLDRPAPRRRAARPPADRAADRVRRASAARASGGSSSRLLRPKYSRNSRVVPSSSGRPGRSRWPTTRIHCRSSSVRVMFGLTATPRTASISARVIGWR